MLANFLAVGLLLLNTSSSSHLIPSPRAYQQQSVPSNTSLSSNHLKEYIIYSFITGISPVSRNERIRAHLGMILSPADVQEFGGEYTGVEFWRVIMSDMQREAFVGANPNVSI